MRTKILTVCLILTFLLTASLVLRYVGALDAHIKGANRPERTFKNRRPPLPNFREPINYVAWLNEYIAQGKNRENAATYAGFWRDGDDEEYMPDPSKVVRDRLREMIRGPNWKAGEYPEVEAYIGNAAGYITVLRQEASKPECWLQLTPAPEFPRCNGSLPNSISGQYAVWVLLVQGWQEGERQGERMREAWRVGLQYSNHLALSKMQLLHIRASFTRLTLCQSIRDALHHGVIRPEDYAVILDLLSGTETARMGLSEGLFSEWGWSLSLLQELYAGGKFNKSFAREYVLLGSRTGIAQLIDPLRALRIRPDRLVPAMDEHFASVLRIVDGPLSIGSLHEIRRIESTPTKLVPSDHPLRWLVRPRLDRVYVQALRALTSLRGTRALLLIHQYRAREGRWPDSLEQIDVPEGLDCLADPFSDNTFVYKRSDNSFLLYSVSEDGIDNDGSHKEWSRGYETEAGTDFVFWPVQLPTGAEK